MYEYLYHQIKVPQPVHSPLAALCREFERARPQHGIGEGMVRWREAAKLEGWHAMMPDRCIGHA
jgi:hypothetical protein